VYYGDSTNVGNAVSHRELVRLTREHNDANILSLGADFVSEAEAKEALKVFFETRFSGNERHARRLAKF
jgi:ribose 5-phosphate isomerase B